MSIPTSGSKPRLVVRRGPNPDNVFVLRRAITIVGREPLNDVVLPDPEVSRRHARIFWEAGAFLIEDLNSTNGTYVNGRRISDKTRLASGDIIDFGETIRVIYEVDIGSAGEHESQEMPLQAADPMAMLETRAPFPGDRATAKPMRPTVRHKIAETDPHERPDTHGDDTFGRFDDDRSNPAHFSSHWFLLFGLFFILVIILGAIGLYFYLSAALPGLF